MGAAVAMLAVVNVLLAIIVVSLLRSHADILKLLHDAGLSEAPGARPSDPGTGWPRPDVPREDRALPTAALDLAGETPTGDAVTVSLTAAPRTLLAFLSSGCLTCRELWATVDTEGHRRLEELGARLVVVGKSPAEESPSALADLQTPMAPTILSSDAWAHFEVPVSPYFVLVDGRERRVIGEGAGRSWAQVARLLQQSLADAAHGSPEEDVMDRRRFLTGRDRARRADRALLDAGIGPDGEPLRTDDTSHESRSGDA